MQRGREIWLQDFEMQRRDGSDADPAKLGSRFTDAFLAVWGGRAENDGFNRLVVTADLTWRQAMVLRAYCRFVLQGGVAFSQSYMEEVLSSNSGIAATLSKIFEAQFNPALQPARRTSEVARHQKELARQLDTVTSLDEDRILRRFASAIAATLRTNHFQADTSHPNDRF